MAISPRSLAGTLTEQFSRSFNSFSGSDIKCTFGPMGTVIGELQGVSYTISREKAPIYTMGSKDPRGFARGKRGIAGSLVFAIFDRDSLLAAMREGGAANFITSTDELTLTDFRSGGHPEVQSGQGILRNGSSLSTSGSTGLTSEDPRQTSYTAHPAWYADQLPPFNIVINGVNEYGAAAVMRIHNVEILNSGSGISIDDIMIDQTMTFTCTNIVPWRPLPYLDPQRATAPFS